MALTVQNVYGLLLRSKLLPLDQAKKLFDRWQAEAGAKASSPDHFVRWLVNQNAVTEYQGALLSRGHQEGFFLGQYKIQERLGRGRMAGVYKAVHQLGQTVAIKVLPPSKAKDPQLFGRFQREARLAMKLKHPNVVRSFQVGEEKGLHFLVMEYLEGETLEETLQRRKRLPPAEAVRLIFQALQGLQHIHDQGLIHRDLKPANLMLVPGPAPGKSDTTTHATIKILDIGLGRAFFDENAPSEGGEDPQLTGEGVLLGTPDYLAPEQARNARAVDIRADIYSLGCVLYHTLTGQPPFPDTNIIQQMIRHATETPKPLQAFNPEIPDGLQLIVNYMMSKDPAQRYPTPERAAQGLQMFLEAGSEPAQGLPQDGQMTAYLGWLEGTPGAPVAAESPPPSPAPRPAPAWPAPAAGTAEPPRKKMAVPVAPVAVQPPPPPPPPPAPMAAPVAPVMHPPLTPTPAVEVELVPQTPAASPSLTVRRRPRRKTLSQRFNLTRRDWLLIWGGAGGVVGAVLIGWILSRLLGRGRSDLDQPESSKSSP